MLAAGLLGVTIFLALVIADWIYFMRMNLQWSDYGCPVARLQDRLESSPSLHLYFDPEGLLRLPHGIARLFPGHCTILLRPHSHLFSTRLLTAWPMKATIHLKSAEHSTQVDGDKRVPWSSALLTLAWLVIVAAGTVGYVITFLINEGFSSFGGVLLGIGVTALGMIVLTFGLVIVAVAYRLENQRLTQTYEELRQVLAGGQRKHRQS